MKNDDYERLQASVTAMNLNFKLIALPDGEWSFRIEDTEVMVVSAVDIRAAATICLNRTLNLFVVGFYEAKDIQAQLDASRECHRLAKDDYARAWEKLRALKGIITRVGASLKGAVSLLNHSPKTGASSDKMFDEMVKGYQMRIDEASAAITQEDKG